MQTRYALMISFLTLLTLPYRLVATESFYYGQNGPIELSIDSSKLTIKLFSETTIIQQQQMLQSLERFSGVIQDSASYDGFIVVGLNNTAGLDAFMDTLRALEIVELVEPYYLAGDVPVLVGEAILAIFGQVVDSSYIDSLCLATGVILDRQVMQEPYGYRLKNSKSTQMTTLEIGNRMHELSEVLFAHPDFMMPLQFFTARNAPYRSFDYYESYASHVKRVIGPYGIASTWDFRQIVSPQVVAVIDNGWENHEDLDSQRVVHPLNVVDFSPVHQMPFTDSHGMSVAGLICANHTLDSIAGNSPNTGMLSMDPNAFLLPIDIPVTYSGIRSSHIVTAFNHARRFADVVNCSWGWWPPGEEPPGFTYPAVDYAIELAATLGRGGKGCVVVCAAGNGGFLNAELAWPARLPTVIAVASVDLQDKLYKYSSRGTGLDLVAPGGQLDVFSLDQQGVEGYNSSSGESFDNCAELQANLDVDYMCAFGGTSAAAPLVSGAASLLLSRFPNLSGQAATLILKNSADKTLDHGLTIGFQEDNLFYGHGRVDAFNAILSMSRGNCDNQGGIDISDLMVLIDNLFINNIPMFPNDLLGDVNCDGTVDISDLGRFIDHLFISNDPFDIPCFETGPYLD